MTSLPTNKEIVYGSVSFSLAGIRALFGDLTEIIKEQGEIEISQMKKRDDQSQEEFDANKLRARNDIFKLLATISYTDGSSLHSSDPNHIKLEENGPLIDSIYVSNITPYKINTGVEPEHLFTLFIDFGQPPLLDAGRLVSSPTENATKLTIRGTRSAWRSAIEEAVRKRIKKRRPLRTYFHGGFVYDLGLILLGLPLVFYACWKSASLIEKFFGQVNVVLSAAAYVYVGLVALWAYRIFFSYTKWAFPMVELTDQATLPSRHRKLWWALIIAAAGKLFWDFGLPYVYEHWLK